MNTKHITAILLSAMLVGCGGIRPAVQQVNLDKPETYIGEKTVYQEYKGTPGDNQSTYNFKMIENREWGNNIIYGTDLGNMTMTLNRGRVYKDVVRNVPYGMCLDFINENMGKTSGGWRLVAIKCEQDGKM
jgi:hypothetical protein